MRLFPAICLTFAALALGSCNLLTPKPKDMAVQPIPAPSAGIPQLYADGETVSLQVRPGDCAKAGCLAYTDGKWRPMPKTSLRTLPLLAVSEATGSEYSDSLWRSVAPGRAVLINAGAAQQTMAGGHLDGLRIGLSDGARRTYLTTYAVEKTGDNGHPLGDGRVFVPVRAEVIVHGGQAWLLHQRADRSANLVDLFAILERPGTMHCLPGLVLDTSPWAGPVETALSPTLFVSRAMDTTKDAARRQAIIAACPAKPTNPTLKERLGIRSE